MAFTIRVCRQKEEDDFTFEELDMTHVECRGGRIGTSFEKEANAYLLYCERCGMESKALISNDGTVAIINTAIDGEKRSVEAPDSSDVSATTYVIRT